MGAPDAERRRTSAARSAAALAALCAAAVLGGCSASTNTYGVTASPQMFQAGQPVPDSAGHYKIGKPYKVAGRWYKPEVDPGYDEVGLASWYGLDFHGRRTANGEVFDRMALTAAHPTLPLPTYARVTNLENGRSVVVRINDRGPFASDRLIDVSRGAAEVLDFKGQGTAKVRVQYVGLAPLDGNDGQWLTTTVRYDGQPVGPVMVAGRTSPSVPVASASASAPSQVAFAQAPTPKAPVGSGNVTYSWVSGYAEPSVRTVDDAFRMFDDGDDVIVIVIAQVPPAQPRMEDR
jgi:peptidoglycan lytic transglycosylase